MQLYCTWGSVGKLKLGSAQAEQDDILNCGNFSVISEVENMSINNSDLFVD
jgi:hypothetical protein